MSGSSNIAAGSNWLQPSTVFGVIAPAAAIMTGAMFFAGYTAIAIPLERLGISGDVVSITFPAIAARGYVLTVGTYMVCFLVYLVLLQLDVFGSAIRTWLSSPSGQPLSTDKKFIRALIVFIATFTLLALPALSALYFVGQHSTRLQNIITSGCAHDCFIYRIGNLRRIGHPVAADTNRIIIATVNGVRILDLSKVEEIRPYVAAADPSRQRSR